MGNLIKPVDYANKMGISRQAVYAKIKKGILSSRNIGGKIFIVMDKTSSKKSTSTESSVSEKTNKNGQSLSSSREQQKLLQAKDETISILKETVKDLKETNRMITSTLRGEVELLKDAFGEMKMLYSLQLEHKKQGDAIEVDTVDTQEDNSEEWMELSDFFALHNISKKKKQAKIERRFKKRLKKGDSRLDIYNGEIVFLVDADFDDILQKA
jgi:hypothetical protein